MACGMEWDNKELLPLNKELLALLKPPLAVLETQAPSSGNLNGTECSLQNSTRQQLFGGFNIQYSGREGLTAFQFGLLATRLAVQRFLIKEAGGNFQRREIQPPTFKVDQISADGNRA